MTPSGNGPKFATPPSIGRSSPAGQSQTNFNSAFVEIDLFTFDPARVVATLHRPGGDGSTPVTEVLYMNHQVTVEDPNQALYFYLRKHLNPKTEKTTL